MGHKIDSRLSSVVIFIQLVALVTGISMRNASIPHYGVKDGVVQLTCDFDAESDKLLNLKWYKDESEFFRYAGNHVQVFPVEGVNVDVLHSTQKVVTLKNITLKTSGTYRCEVLADKSFQRLTHQGQMIVVAPPLSDPEIVIRGDVKNQSRVSVGDRVIGNCTSYRSKPPASLMFYINGQKADYGDITEYTPVNETGGLETSTLGFNFLIESSRLPRPTSKLELKCTASIGNHYRVSILQLLETKITAQPSSKRSQFPSASHQTASVSHYLWLGWSLAISRVPITAFSLSS